MPTRLIGRHGLVVLAIIPTLGLAACGSKDKKDTNRAGGHGSALSKGDFVKQANALCKAGTAEAGKIEAGFSSPPESADLQKIADFLAKYNPKAKALVPPDGPLKTAWDAFGTSNKAQLADARAAVAANDTATRTAAEQRLSSDGNAPNDALKAAGLTDCVAS